MWGFRGLGKRGFRGLGFRVYGLRELRAYPKLKR